MTKFGLSAAENIAIALLIGTALVCDIIRQTTDQRWVVNHVPIKTSDQLDYRIRAPKRATGRQSVIVNEAILDQISQSGWPVGRADTGAFEVFCVAYELLNISNN